MDNLFAFHGADHKVGTTMLAQSAAELLAAGNGSLKVLLLSLNGRKSAEYISDDVWPIDRFRAQIESGIHIDKNLLTVHKGLENMYMLAGIENELEERFYMPETAIKLMAGLAAQFDLIIADTGSQLDNGLALGGLAQARKRFLVLTQSESTVRRCEKQRKLFQELKIVFDCCVINKYGKNELYTADYLAERLNLDKSGLYKVDRVPYGSQAEMEYKTILEYNADKYAEDVLCIANEILREMGIAPIKIQRKRKWKNFI